MSAPPTRPRGLHVQLPCALAGLVITPSRLDAYGGSGEDETADKERELPRQLPARDTQRAPHVRRLST